MLDQSTVNRYVKNDTRCPFCGSSNLEGHGAEIDGSGASQDISCNSCGEEWTDLYQLVGVNYDGNDHFAE